MEVLILLGLGIAGTLLVQRGLKKQGPILPPDPKLLDARAEQLDDQAITEGIRRDEQRQAERETPLIEAEADAAKRGITTHRTESGKGVIPQATEDTPEERAKRFREWAAKNMAKPEKGAS